MPVALNEIVSANVGDYDEVPEQPIRVLYHRPRRRKGEHPRMTAKRTKMLDAIWGGLSSHYVTWIDANMRVTNPAFPEEAAAWCGDAPLAVWRHPDRDCIYDEAIASLVLALPKYDREPIITQVGHYARTGHPAHWGLYAGGVVVWNQRHRWTRGLAEAWFHECERWTYQDQLSLPVLLRRTGITPALLPHDLRANPWLTIGAHRRAD
jgi:hypothetical protein